MVLHFIGKTLWLILIEQHKAIALKSKIFSKPNKIEILTRILSRSLFFSISVYRN